MVSEIRINRVGRKVTRCSKCDKIVGALEAVWHAGGIALCELHDTEFRRVQSISIDAAKYCEPRYH